MKFIAAESTFQNLCLCVRTLEILVLNDKQTNYNQFACKPHYNNLQPNVKEIIISLSHNSDVITCNNPIQLVFILHAFQSSHLSNTCRSVDSSRVLCSQRLFTFYIIFTVMEFLTSLSARVDLRGFGIITKPELSLNQKFSTGLC